MRCLICHRQMLTSAVPCMQIGPKCARDRGLLPEPTHHTRIFSSVTARSPEELQTDWINLSNSDNPN